MSWAYVFPVAGLGGASLVSAVSLARTGVMPLRRDALAVAGMLAALGASSVPEICATLRWRRRRVERALAHPILFAVLNSIDYGRGEDGLEKVFYFVNPLSRGE